MKISVLKQNYIKMQLNHDVERRHIPSSWV